MNNIQARVKEHYDFVCEQYNEDQILGVFLYGSQNYNLHTELSDVDTKAIYIPTLAELAFEKPISKELHLPNGEHCEVKDIREIIKNFKKQNINFIELLYTDYCILNDKYKKLWLETFVVARECIARYDVHQGIHSMSHQALHTLRQAVNSHDGAEVAKKISNAMRLLYFLERYVRGESYIKCLVPEGDAHMRILNMKKRTAALSDVYFCAYEILKTSLEGYAEGDYKFLVDSENKKMVDELMNKATLEMIKLNF